MVRDANAPISLEEANEIAQRTTEGVVSVIKEDGTIKLAHRDYPTRIELKDDDLTEAGIEDSLEDWEEWPTM